jgi:hypothetical protein
MRVELIRQTEAARLQLNQKTLKFKQILKKKLDKILNN